MDKAVCRKAKEGSNRYAHDMPKMTRSSFNGRDLTTSDLEYLRERFPTLLSEHGLQLRTVAATRAADIYFSAADTPPEEAAAIAAASGSVLTFLECESFEPDVLLEDAPDPETHPDVAKILTSAAKRKGQTCRLTLHWATNGLLCSWEANAAWAETFRHSIRKAATDAATSRTENYAADFAGRKVTAERIISELMADTRFRGAPPRQRMAVAKGLVPVSEDADGSRALALGHLSSRDAAETMRLTVDIKSRMDEIAADLAATPKWAKTSLASARKALAHECLIEITGGWCMPTPLAVALRDRTLEFSEKNELAQALESHR